MRYNRYIHLTVDVNVNVTGDADKTTDQKEHLQETVSVNTGSLGSQRRRGG